MGQPVPLTGKAFDLLVVLVRHGGHLVTKDELMQEVWPDVCVQETNLTVNVSALRKVLERERSGRKVIQTVPSRGYRFVAPVVASAVSPTSIPRAAPANPPVAAPVTSPATPALATLRSSWGPRRLLGFVAAVLILAIGTIAFLESAARERRRPVRLRGRAALHQRHSGQQVPGRWSVGGRAQRTCAIAEPARGAPGQCFPLQWLGRRAKGRRPRARGRGGRHSVHIRNRRCSEDTSRSRRR